MLYKNLLSAAGNFSVYDIEYSLRFDKFNNYHLTRTPSVAGNRRTWTWSAWIKPSYAGTPRTLFYAFDSGTDDAVYFYLDDGNRLTLYTPDGFGRISVPLFEFTVWSHVLVAFDSTQANSIDRIRIYLNGLEFDVTGNPDLNKEYAVNATTEHTIGEKGNTSNEYYDGYMADVHFIDGQALGPEYFGRFDESRSTNWGPREYNGSYGTNGYFLEFGNSAALGNDTSGRDNHWVTNNVASYDQMPDTPTNNFCILNPLESRRPVVLSRGSLRVNLAGDVGITKSTFFVPSGKWYWEVRGTAEFHANGAIGIVDAQEDPSLELPLFSDSVVAVNCADGNIYYGTQMQEDPYMDPIVDGDIIGIALDLDSVPNTIRFYKNNIPYGLIVEAPLLDYYWTPALILRQATNNSARARVNFGADSSFAGAVTRQFNPDYLGRGDFYYTPPEGYLALMSKNSRGKDLNEIDNPRDHVRVLTDRYISGFKVPIKADAQSQFNNELAIICDYRTVNGYGESIQLLDSLRDPDTAWSTAFATGPPEVNTGGEFPYVVPSGPALAWVWRAGDGAAVGSTYGTVPSTRSTNPISKFSIVRWTGTGADVGTVEHGLLATPDMMIVKQLTPINEGGTGWPSKLFMRASGEGNSYPWGFWGTLGTSTFFDIYDGNTLPDALTFPVLNEPSNLGRSLNTPGAEYVAYVYASVPGKSQSGLYIGNGRDQQDGSPFISMSFSPSIVMIRRVANSQVLVTGPMYVHNRKRYGRSIYLGTGREGSPANYFFWNGLLIASDFGVVPQGQNALGGVYWYYAWAANSRGGVFM